MGGVWESLGRLLGTLGPSLAVFLEFRNSAAAGSSELLGQDGLQEAFWIDFGAILGGFREVLGRIWTNFSMDFGTLGGRTRKHGRLGNTLGTISS